MISKDAALKIAKDWLKKLNRDNLEFKSVFYVEKQDEGFKGFSDEKVDKWIADFKFDMPDGFEEVNLVLEIDAKTGEVLKETVV
jgi:hypothetical protein